MKLIVRLQHNLANYLCGKRRKNLRLGHFLSENILRLQYFFVPLQRNFEKRCHM